MSKESKAMTRLLLARSRWWLVAGIAVVGGAVLGASQLGLHAMGGANSEDAPATLGYLPKEKQEKPEVVTGVETLPVEARRANEVLPVTGHLSADERSNVSSNTSGIIAEVLVERGSVVSKGDVLVRIDPTDAKNALAEGMAMAEELRVKLMLTSPEASFDPEKLPELRLTRAALELARSNLDRTAALYEKKVETAEMYDRVRTEHELAVFRYDQARHQAHQLHQSYKTALTRINTLRKAVADTTIVAPFDGWVVEKRVEVGERISSQGGSNCVAVLIRTDPLRLTLTVPQQHISRIKEGQPVQFEVDAYPHRIFAGKVRYVAPAVADEGRSLTVEAVVPNADRILKPGLFAKAALQLDQETTELSVPVTAVQQHGDAAGRVFVLRDGQVREQIVALGQISGDRVEITSGLAPSDRIVARPEKVREGVAIRQ